MPTSVFQTISHYAELIMDFSWIPIMRRSISQHTNLSMGIFSSSAGIETLHMNTDTKWKSCLPSIICRCQSAGTVYRSCQCNLSVSSETPDQRC